jgi:hypothetical protein
MLRGVSHASVRFPAERTSFFSSLSDPLCLSRACLGLKCHRRKGRFFFLTNPLEEGQPYKKTAPFHEFLPYLSQACLGKMIILSIKVEQNEYLIPDAEPPQAMS